MNLRWHGSNTNSISNSSNTSTHSYAYGKGTSSSGYGGLFYTWYNPNSGACRAVVVNGIGF